MIHRHLAAGYDYEQWLLDEAHSRNPDPPADPTLLATRPTLTPPPPPGCVLYRAPGDPLTLSRHYDYTPPDQRPPPPPPPPRPPFRICDRTPPHRRLLRRFRALFGGSGPA